MDEMPRYLGTTEFVDGLCDELMVAPFKRKYRSEKWLRADVVRVIKRFVSSKLAPLDISFSVGRQEAVREEKIEPVYIFGSDFLPDVSIEVGGFPTVALDLKLVKENEDPVPKLSSAIGQAMVYSRQYPSVVAFVLHRGKAEEHKHWLDREFKGELWTRHKIRLVIREEA